MGGMDWLLEIALMALLGLTLLHAVRLERALGTLRRDRTALGEMVAGFDSSTRQAENGLGKLHVMTQEATQQAARTIEGAAVLKDDLTFLTKRGEHLADRLEQLIRAGRALDAGQVREQPAVPNRADPNPPRPRSKSERDLQQALLGVR